MTSVQPHCALPESTEVCLASARRQETTGSSSRTVPNWSSHIRCSLLIHTSSLWNLQSESWAGNLFWKYFCIAQQSGNKSESKGTFHSSRESSYEAYWEFTKFCKNRNVTFIFQGNISLKVRLRPSYWWVVMTAAMSLLLSKKFKWL